MLEPLTSQTMITVLVTMLFIATIADLRQRRIPNILVVAGVALGIVGHAWFAAGAGILTATAGMLVGLLCLLPLYALGALGAGDVKLMAMCGAFLGPVQGAVASVSTLVAGGVLGLAWYFWWLHTPAKGPMVARQHDSSVSPGGTQATGPSSIPYAIAITAGVLVSFKVTPGLS